MSYFSSLDKLQCMQCRGLWNLSPLYAFYAFDFNSCLCNFFAEGQHTLTKTIVTSKVGKLAMFTKKKSTCIGCKAVLDDNGKDDVPWTILTKMRQLCCRGNSIIACSASLSWWQCEVWRLTVTVSINQQVRKSNGAWRPRAYPLLWWSVSKLSAHLVQHIYCIVAFPELLFNFKDNNMQGQGQENPNIPTPFHLLVHVLLHASIFIWIFIPSKQVIKVKNQP